MTKWRIFLIWVVTVFVGSFINTLIGEGKLNLDIFVIFMAASAALGSISLIATLIFQHIYGKKDITNHGIQFKLILIQFICYVIIFAVLQLANIKSKSFHFEVYLIGLSYLLVGVLLTFLSKSTSTK